MWGPISFRRAGRHVSSESAVMPQHGGQRPATRHGINARLFGFSGGFGLSVERTRQRSAERVSQMPRQETFFLAFMPWKRVARSLRMPGFLYNRPAAILSSQAASATITRGLSGAWDYGSQFSYHSPNISFSQFFTLWLLSLPGNRVFHTIFHICDETSQAYHMFIIHIIKQLVK